MIDLSPLNRWRTALRLAWRDLKRNPRGGALVASLVALPAVGLMLVATIVASQQPTVDELIQRRLGTTEARVSIVSPDGAPIVQLASGEDIVDLDEPGPLAEPLTPGQVANLLPAGARVIPVGIGSDVVTSGDARVRVTLVAGETWDPALAGPYRVTSGTAPAADDEVLATRELLATLEIGIGDHVTLVDGGRTFMVTGTMAQRGYGYGNEMQLFGFDNAFGSAIGFESTSWYVVDKPMSWSDVQALNAHGLIALSREVLSDPPGNAPVAVKSPVDPGVIAIAALGLAVALLLAGAGFAVTFRRQQRQSALIGATGGSPRDLAAQGLARGLWLGLAGGAGGAVLGILAGMLWVAIIFRWGSGDFLANTWGYHVPYGYALATVAYGGVVGVLSALTPAIAASRLDVVAVMRGSQRPARVRRWPVYVGLAAIALGSVCLLVSARGYDSALDLADVESYDARTSASRLLLAGFAAAFVGAIMLVSALMRGMGRLASHGGTALRLAARDATRNAGRTVPVVAAIAAVLALSGVVLLSVDRDQRLSDASWIASSPVGDAIARFSDYVADPPPDAELVAGLESEANLAVAAARAVFPDADITLVRGFLGNFEGRQELTAVPTLVIPERNVCPWFSVDDRQTPRERAADPRCNGVRANLGAVIFDIGVGDVATLGTLVGGEPSPEAVAALESGGVVVFNEALLDGTSTTIGLWDYTVKNFPDAGVEPARALVLPAVLAQPLDNTYPVKFALISRETAAAIGWPVVPSLLLIDAPEPITQAQEAKLKNALAGATADRIWVTVERGPWQQLPPSILAIFLTVVFAFVAGCTAIAVGLARADARNDDFTLASLGAPPRVVRAVAAWQAALIVGVATAIGLGGALAWIAVDGNAYIDAGFAPPWALVAAALIGTPLLAGGAAWVLTKAPQALHYRLAA